MNKKIPRNPMLAYQQGLKDGAEECDHKFMSLQRDFTMQQCKDTMLIMLHEEFGFGPDRGKKALDEFERIFLENCMTVIEMADGDEDMCYVKGDMDRRLHSALGDYFEPWKARYPDEHYNGGCQS